MGIFATAGPFVFIYFQRKAEGVILKEQKRYQEAILLASRGLSKIKTREQISRVVATVLHTTMSLKEVEVYLQDEDKYRLQNIEGDAGGHEKDIPFAHPVVDCARNLGTFLVPELEHKAHENPAYAHNTIVPKAHEYFLKHPASVVVPVTHDDKLLAIVILGEKSNNTLYSESDLNVLDIIAFNAALAMENAIYLKAETARMAEEGARARRESMDMMVATMAHEIDNPLTFMMGEADFLEEMVKSGRYALPPDVVELIAKACRQIITGSKRISNIIEAVEHYAKKERGKFEAVFINELMVPFRSLLLLQQKRFSKVKVELEIQPDLPPVWAETVIIEEILYNFSENAIHAAHHQNLTGGGRVGLKIFSKEDHIVIEVTDNGYGIEAKVLKQLFQVPTTTKGSMEGTGLGLYRIRQIVDMLKGRARAESEGKDKGAKFTVELPVYKGDDLQPRKRSRRIF